MKKHFILLLVFAIISSCSTTQKTKRIDLPQKYEATDILINKVDLEYINAYAKFSAEVNGSSQSFAGRYRLAGQDSISMDIFGPFGIAVGRLYSSSDLFLFHNIFENSAYEGIPSAKNFQRTAQINVSFADLIAIVRAEPLNDPDEYKLFDLDTNKNIAIYQNIEKKRYIELIKYSFNEGAITQYQRKTSDGSLYLKVSLQNYMLYKNWRLPETIVFEFPLNNSKLEMNIKEMTINTYDGKPFSFSLPSGIEKINLDKN